MYTPRHFAEDRVDVAVALARAAGFGHLVVQTDDGLTATPLPFVIDDAATSVQAHVARANPLWRSVPCEALLIVTASDAYVSPSWYPAKAEHGRVVPTWNFEVVHLSGRLVAHDDAAWTARHVAALTDRNEASLPRPWSVTDAPDGYVDGLARGIVGVELLVDRWECKRKLGQNRGAADRDGAIRGLRDTGEPRRRVSDAMQEALDIERPGGS